MTEQFVAAADSTAGLAAALLDGGVRSGRPVVVLIGGAAGLAGHHRQAVAAFVTDWLVPALTRWDAVVVDGGTDAGVMRIIGEARSATGARFELIGVVSAENVEPENHDGGATLEQHHSHVLLVPGTDWGDESPWISATAALVAGTARSVTLVANGGEVTYADVEQSILASRPVVVLAGSGRSADEIATAASDLDDGEASSTVSGRAVAVAVSPYVQAASLSRPAAAIDLLAGLLGLAASAGPDH